MCFFFGNCRMLLFKQPQTDRHHSPLQTTQSSWNVTTVEERSVWNLKFWTGRWDPFVFDFNEDTQALSQGLFLPEMVLSDNKTDILYIYF